jgi:nucleoside-diphosphate-sugar epimerase
MECRSGSVGEVFNAVSPAALTLRGYAESMYAWFGRAPKLRLAPYEQWAVRQDEEDARATLDHIARSPSHSIEKARLLLGYAPRYTSLEAVRESVRWLIAEGQMSAKT